MKSSKKLLALVITSAALLAACNGTVNIPNAVLNGAFATQLTANGSAKDVLLSTSTDTNVQSQVSTDLQPYREEFDQDAKVWVVYYYSPAKKKSYRCRKNADKTTTVTEETTKVYQANQTINITQVNIDGDKAAATAAQAVSPASPAPSTMPSTAPSTTPSASPSSGTGASVGANTTINNNVTINNITLISPVQFNQMAAGSTTQNPVWVCNVNNQTVYVDASTGTTINTGSGSATGGTTATGSGSATGSTTVGGTVTTATPSPIAMPSATASASGTVTTGR